MKENILKLVFNDTTNVSQMNETINGDFIGALVRFNLTKPFFYELFEEIKRRKTFEIEADDEFKATINQLKFNELAFQFFNEEKISNPTFEEKLSLFETRYYYIENLLSDNLFG